MRAVHLRAEDAAASSNLDVSARRLADPSPAMDARDLPPGAVEGLTLALSVPDTVWSPGDTVELQATLTNVGDRALALDAFGELNVRYPHPLSDAVSMPAWELPGCVAADANRLVAKDQLIRLDPGRRFVKMLTCRVVHNLEPGRQHVWLTYMPHWPDSVVKETEPGVPQVAYPDLSTLTMWDGFVRSPGVWVDLVASSDAQRPETTELDRYYELAESAQDAYHAGRLDEAALLARELLRKAEVLPRDWNYGNARHHGHRLLGLVALRRGDGEEAARELLASADTPGSPQLNAVGPDFSLARALLESGDRATVIDFLKRCGRFWNDPRLLQYLALVSTGQVPDEWR
jgi:hypothetical protein